MRVQWLLRHAARRHAAVVVVQVLVVEVVVGDRWARFTHPFHALFFYSGRVASGAALGRVPLSS